MKYLTTPYSTERAKALFCLKGSNTMSKINLMPIEQVNSNRTPEQHSRDSRKAGIASGEARRKRKTFKEAIKLLLETEVKDADGVLKTVQDIGLDSLAKKLMDGDLQTFLAFRDTIGEKPVDKVEQETTTKIKVDLTDE